MSELTVILDRVRSGDRLATEVLLPLVYDELRRLAQRHLTREAPGQTLQATALVHEAYVRMVRSTVDAAPEDRPAWENSAHFYGAASEAMRRILIEIARKKRRRGGAPKELTEEPPSRMSGLPAHDLLDIDAALQHLAEEDSRKAQLVKLRFYAGLSMEEAARCVGISRSTADRYWAYSRAWLFERLESGKKLHASEATDG
jgi:RNA polymerase sigma factor (TIGR02999 family)